VAVSQVDINLRGPLRKFATVRPVNPVGNLICEIRRNVKSHLYFRKGQCSQLLLLLLLWPQTKFCAAATNHAMHLQVDSGLPSFAIYVHSSRDKSQDSQ